MKRIIWLSLLLPCAAMGQPVVDEISYLYLSLGYLDTQLDGPGELDGSGLGIEGSFEVRDHIHLFGAYQAFELDADEELDGTSKVLGIGAHFGLGDRLSVFGRVGVADVEANVGFANPGGQGYSVGAGVRFRPAMGYEIRAGVDHLDVDNNVSDTGFSLGGDLFLTDVVTLSVDLNERDGGSTLLLGGRFYFGNATARGLDR